MADPPTVAHPSEFPDAAALIAHPVPLAQLAPPGQALATFPAPAPNYQDLSDSSDGEDAKSGEEEEDWEAIVAAAEAAFTESEIASMQHFLKERGLFAFLKEYLEHKAVAPHTLLLAFGVMVRPDTPLTDQLRMLKIACARVLRNREKLQEYNSPQDVVDLLRSKKRILFLTGAGVSTSCGIPDFRSPTGLYARLKLSSDPRFSTLDDPQDMFDLQFFRSDPSVFYSFAKEIYPSVFTPSECHRFVRLLEMEGRLLRNYTQNIDGLFEQVGVERMLNCHADRGPYPHVHTTTGSFATASCLLCRRRFPGSLIESDVFASRVPLCPYCTPELEALEQERQEERERAREERRKKRRKTGRKEGEWDEEDGDGEDGEGEDGDEGKGEWEGKAVIKPDIVFFGEALSDEFDHRLLEDREQVDLLIVMGTSLRVSPVAQLPSHLPHSIPQILINRDPVGHHNFDVCLLGDGDTIVRWLCDELAKGEQTANGQVKGEKEEEEELRRKWNLDGRVPVRARNSTTTAPAAASTSADDPNSSTSPPDAENKPTTSTVIEPEQVGHSHVWLFPGANRQSRWVESVRIAYGSDDDERSGEEEGEDGAVELPASLAPGVVEGEGSDGTDDDDEESGPSSSPAAAANAPTFAHANGGDGTSAATRSEEELQRIAPSFLHPASDLA
ncbi:hypothetical protein JCM10908_001352 [Rhodotorula pacifica]|uniref:uncharacterized protein n=1 Tax=Rhodotorula pacifica TaxID=1495444 RepID=UPI0031783AFD